MINICGLASKKVSIHIYYEKNFSKFCAGWCPHSAICASVPLIVVITLFYSVFFLYTLFLCLIFEKGDDGRNVLILDRTIFYPQGGGQPADTGFIHFTDFNVKFVVHDVRSRDGIVCFLS
jgi:hypothetical protein